MPARPHGARIATRLDPPVFFAAARTASTYATCSDRFVAIS
jgi:hypothetical protein